jgi:hypothetical protein
VKVLAFGKVQRTGGFSDRTGGSWLDRYFEFLRTMSYSSKHALWFYENHQSRVYKPDPGLLVLALEESELPNTGVYLERGETHMDRCTQYMYSLWVYWHNVFPCVEASLKPKLSEHETVNWNMPKTAKTMFQSQKSSCLEYALDP